MVITLINFIKVCHKLKSGILLDEDEIYSLKVFLMYQFSLEQLIYFISSIFFVTIGVILQLNYDFLLCLSICLYILAFILMFLNTPLILPIARKKYEISLNQYLKLHLNKYSGYKLKYTTFLPHTSFDIRKENVYFFYDGYYFHCVESLLKKENYFTFRKNRVFSYPDPNSVNVRSLDFKLSDIVSFSGKLNVKFKEDSTKDILNILSTEETSCRISLSNFKTIYLGASLATYFRSIIPEREIISRTE